MKVRGGTEALCDRALQASRQPPDTRIRYAHIGDLLLFFALACGGDASVVSPPTGTPPKDPPVVTPPKYDVDANGVPRFAAANYIDLSSIARVSTFRSGFGHDYADTFETCRTMKHYFQPRSSVDWTTVGIYAPVNGAISLVRAEQTFGTQLQIRSTAQPAFTFILFHVSPTIPVDTGVRVTAGQRIGSHIGSQTMSDIAVAVDTPAGYKLVSWFDVMTDSLFATYQARGITTRASAIISRADRDANRLTCQGEAYVGPSSLESWIVLN